MFVDTTALAYGQQSSGRVIQRRTVEAPQTDVVMHVTETVGEKGYLLHITFMENGKIIFQAHTQLDNKTAGVCQMTQELKDDNKFSYRIQVTSTQNKDRPKGPPDVTFNVVVHHPTGEQQEFSGKVGSSAKYPPGIDASIPPEMENKLKPFEGPISENIHEIERKSGAQFEPKTDERPSPLLVAGCHVTCVGMAAACMAIACAGTLGAACIVGAFGFASAGYFCEHSCPKEG
jgi:hypothetical protein